MKATLLPLVCIFIATTNACSRSESEIIGTAFPRSKTYNKEYADIPDFPKYDAPSQKSGCPSIPGGAQRLSTMGQNPTVSGIVVVDNSCEGKTFGTITVTPTGRLLFKDQAVAFSVETVNVQGELWIGSETCRYTSPITIRFTLTRSQYNSKSDKEKYNGGIQVTGAGRLEMHGAFITPTWTRLAAHAKAGDCQIVLQKEKDDFSRWVNQEVVLVTSIWKDGPDQNQNERRKITNIKTQGEWTIATLDKALDFEHYAGAEYYQSEVGVLSRSINLVSQNAASDEFGGHVKCIGTSETPGTTEYDNAEVKVVCRLEGVRTAGFGQARVLGRYPFHFHIMKDYGSESYIKDCSCDFSNWRCVAIHGTNNTYVERNVAFDIQGHAYYLEDGIEQHNYLMFNLGAYVHTIGPAATGGVQDGEIITESSTVMKPSDAAACVFYLSNPNNHVCGNAGSGGWSVYGFPIMPQPTGVYKRLWDYPSERQNTPNIPQNWIWQQQQKNGQNIGRTNCQGFNGNTAHSSGHQWASGSCVYSGGYLKYESVGSNNIPYGKLVYSSGRRSRATTENDDLFSANPRDGRFTWMNTKVWMCNRGANTWGPRLDILHYEAMDFERGGVLFGESSLQYARLTGHTGNSNLGKGIDYARENTGFRLYDVSVKTILHHVTFRRFYATGSERCIGGTIHSDKFKPWWITTASYTKFEDVDPSIIIEIPWHETGSSHMFNVYDLDGTLTMQPYERPMIVGSNNEWWRAWEQSDITKPRSCTNQLWGGAWVCEAAAGLAGVGIYIETPSGPFKTYDDDGVRLQNGHYTDADWSRIHTGSVTQWNYPTRTIPMTINHIMAGLSGRGWYLFFDKTTGVVGSEQSTGTRGTPTTFELKPVEVPAGVFIMVALSFKPNVNVQQLYFTVQSTKGKEEIKTHLTRTNELNDVLKGKTVNGQKLYGLHYYLGPALSQSAQDSKYKPSNQQWHLIFMFASDTAWTVPDVFTTPHSEGTGVPMTRGSWTRNLYHIEVSGNGCSGGFCRADYDLPSDTNNYKVSDLLMEPYYRPCEDINKVKFNSLAELNAHNGDEVYKLTKAGCSAPADQGSRLSCIQSYGYGQCMDSWARDSKCPTTCQCHMAPNVGPYTCSPSAYSQMRLKADGSGFRQAEYFDRQAVQPYGWTPCHEHAPIRQPDPTNPCILEFCDEEASRGGSSPVWKSKVKEAGSLCDDGDADTSNDQCTLSPQTQQMMCAGEGLIAGNRISRDSGDKWSALIRCASEKAADRVTWMELKDTTYPNPLTLPCTLKDWCGSDVCMYCKPPDKPIKGDVTAYFKTAADSSKIHTFRFLDWNYAFELPFAVTQSSDSKWWFRADITPGDYVRSARAEFYSEDASGQRMVEHAVIECDGGRCDSLPFHMDQSKAGIAGVIHGDMHMYITPIECRSCNPTVAGWTENPSTSSCKCSEVKLVLNCIGGRSYDGGKKCWSEDLSKSMTCSTSVLNQCGSPPETSSLIKCPQVESSSVPTPYKLDVSEVQFSNCDGSTDAKCKSINGQYIKQNLATMDGVTVYCKGCYDNSGYEVYLLHRKAHFGERTASFVFSMDTYGGVQDSQSMGRLQLDGDFGNLCNIEKMMYSPKISNQIVQSRVKVTCPCQSPSVEDTDDLVYESNATESQSTVSSSSGSFILTVGFAGVAFVAAVLILVVAVVYKQERNRRAQDADYTEFKDTI